MTVEILNYTCPYCGVTGEHKIDERRESYFVQHAGCPESLLSVYWEPFVDTFVLGREFARLKDKYEKVTRPPGHPAEITEGGVGFKKRKGDMVLAECREPNCLNTKWIPLEGSNNDILNPWYCWSHKAAHQNVPFLHADCRL